MNGMPSQAPLPNNGFPVSIQLGNLMNTPYRCCRAIFGVFILFMAVIAQAAPPPLQWAAAIGGTSSDEANGVAVDSAGNVYHTGFFWGTADFDPGPDTFNLTSNGNADIYVQKLDSSGNLLWVVSIGGTGADGAASLALDNDGNVYVTGGFSLTVDFDPGPGTFNLTSNGESDIYVVKLDSNGNLVWASAMGGPRWDQGYSIAVDGTSQPHVTGIFRNTADFDPGAGTFNLSNVGVEDIFVVKLDNSGGLVWAAGMGGTSDDYGLAIALDGSGNVYTTGYFRNTVDFDPGAGIFDLSSAGSTDIFVQKLSSDGNLVWAVAMGGGDVDIGWGIAVDTTGAVYLIGYFQGTADFDPGPGTANVISAGFRDIFVLKLDELGGLIWKATMGAAGFDTGTAITLDSYGNVYTTGSFSYTVDFDPGSGTYELSTGSVLVTFVQKLDSAGNFIWAAPIYATDYNGGADIAVDGTGSVYVAGQFSGTADFDPSTDVLELTSAGNTDGYVFKLQVLSSTIRHIPVTTGWGLVVLSGLLALVSLLTMRRRIP